MNNLQPKSMSRRWKALGIAIILVFVTRFLILTFVPQIPWHQTSWQSLYTHVNLTVQGDTMKVSEIVRELDVFFTYYTETFQSQSKWNQRLLNAQAGDTLITDSLTWQLMKNAQEFYKESDGTIHPGIGGLIRTWGLEYGQTPRVPSDPEIQTEINKMQSLFYKVLPDQKSLVILSDSAHLALGAFSKGFALEVARQKLLTAGFENFLLEIGGDLVYNGHNSRSKEWSIGLTDPRAKDKLFRILRLPQNYNSLATSGGYENFFIDSLGKKHHHILDPRTGQSTVGTLSATVLSHSGHRADFLATYYFILGKKAVDKDQNDKQSASLLFFENDSLYIAKELEPFLFKTENFLP